MLILIRVSRYLTVRNGGVSLSARRGKANGYGKDVIAPTALVPLGPSFGCCSTELKYSSKWNADPLCFSFEVSMTLRFGLP